jgi:hypothetical protein
MSDYYFIHPTVHNKVAIIFILILGVYKCSKHWLGLIGLCFDILGAYLLATGYLEVMVQAASGWGGGGDIIKNLKKIHSIKIQIGLFCLIIGFIFQALNTL